MTTGMEQWWSASFGYVLKEVSKAMPRYIQAEYVDAVRRARER
jgi:hypothetical protein